ncbi:hypothetical protein J6590_087159 [Homalodisca vitripennis]|nr:hypothetical protein J6590_087159 [Homalodisca vitripennis]
MTGENQLISWTSSVRGRKLSRTCQKENSSAKLTKHLIKQNFKLELLLTCTPRLGVLTPLFRKGQTPSNVNDFSKRKNAAVSCNSPVGNFLMLSKLRRAVGV